MRHAALPVGMLGRGARRAALVLLVVALVLGLLPVSRTYAAGQLDQQQTAQDSLVGNVSFGSSWAQTFTAGLTGALDQVNLPLVAEGPVTGTFTIEIRNVEAGGAPGTTILASITQPSSSLSAFGGFPFPFVSFPLSPPAPVVAGTQYAIVVSSTTGSFSAVRWGGNISDVYPGGSAYVAAPPASPFVANQLLELAFQTFVSPVTVSVGPAQAAEGNAGTTTLSFPVTLSFAVGAPVTATFSLANGTASGGPACATDVDFVNASGTVTIPAGSTTGTATVTVCGDTTLEADETLTLTLAAPNGIALGIATASGTILNDDAATSTPTPTASPTPTLTPTLTPTSTPTPTPVSANQPPEDNQDKKPKQTEEQRQQEQHTNRSGKDDVHTEGTVIAVERSDGDDSLLVTIALGRGETLVVQVFCQLPSCPDIRVGDYLEADGYQNGVGDPNAYFVASDGVEITRNGKKVR